MTQLADYKDGSDTADDMHFVQSNGIGGKTVVLRLVVFQNAERRLVILSARKV